MMEISTATDIGRRAENQDFYGYSDDCFCVCDGHGWGGGQVAEKVLELILDAKIKGPYDKNILKLFKKIDSQIKDPDSGSTCSAAWFKEGKFWVAQLGDSPVYYKSGDSVKTMVWHNVSDPTNPDIEKLRQNRVEVFGLYQCCPQKERLLQLTRSFGDKCFKNQVSKVPDIYEIETDSLVICSDGFKGELETVKKLLDKRASAAEFIDEQREIGIRDNISVITIYV